MKIAPKLCCRSVVWAPTHKAVIHLTEEIGVLDKLPLGVNYSFVAHEFNINASTMLYIQEKEEEVQRSVYEAQVLR